MYQIILINGSKSLCTSFFYKKKFYKKMSLKPIPLPPKTLRKCYENFQSQMSELKLLKTLFKSYKIK